MITAENKSRPSKHDDEYTCRNMATYITMIDVKRTKINDTIIIIKKQWGLAYYLNL